MISKPEISIIIPVYGVEKYIAKSLTSIANQTFENFEAIIVNDGTLDKSIEVAKATVNNDPRFIFLEKENGGQSSARNMGLNYAKGQYIAFLDPDDYLEKSYLASLYNSIILNDSDIAICGMNFILEDGTIVNRFISNLNKYYEQKDILLLNNSISISLCNKLYRASIFTDLRLPEGIIYEDDYLSFTLVYKKKLSLVDQYLYNYIQRKGSTVYSYNPIFLKSYLAVFNNYKQFLKKENLLSQLQNDFESGYLNRFVIRTMINFARYSPNYTADVNEFLKVVDTSIFNRKKIQQYFRFTAPKRWALLLFLYSPKSFKLLYRLQAKIR